MAPRMTSPMTMQRAPVLRAASLLARALIAEAAFIGPVTRRLQRGQLLVHFTISVFGRTQLRSQLLGHRVAGTKDSRSYGTDRTSMIGLISS